MIYGVGLTKCIDRSFAILGVSGSEAQHFADKYGYLFVETWSALVPAFNYHNSYVALQPTYSNEGFAASTDGSSYFDLNAQACIIENYNAQVQGTAVDSVEDIKFSRITELNCSGRGITNLRGLKLMTNLKKLDISYNNGSLGYDLELDALSQLEELDVRGLYGTIDITGNPNLKVLKTDDIEDFLTTAYAQRSDGGSIIMDLSGLKFLYSSVTPLPDVYIPESLSCEGMVLESRLIRAGTHPMRVPYDEMQTLNLCAAGSLFLLESALAKNFRQLRHLPLRPKQRIIHGVIYSKDASTATRKFIAYLRATIGEEEVLRLTSICEAFEKEKDRANAVPEG